MKNTLKGSEFTLRQNTELGEVISVVKDIDNWVVHTRAPFKKTMGEGIATGTITTVVNLWEQHLNETTKGFFVVDYGIGFSPNEKSTKSGKYRYWQARKRVNGKLYALHAGSSQELTRAKIETVCKELLTKIESES